MGQLGAYGVALYVRKYCAASKSSLNVHTSDKYNAVILIVKFALTIHVVSENGYTMSTCLYNESMSKP